MDRNDNHNPQALVREKGDRPTDPLVSAIVSAYNSERFIGGCLEDLEAQTIADRLEIIVIDSGSQQNEWAIVEEFQHRYDNIIYIRTAWREKLYTAWNRAIHIARGKYITNANTDDRHFPFALEVQARALNRFPDVGIVYGDVLGTPHESDVLNWSARTANGTADLDGIEQFELHSYPDFSLLSGLRGSNFSPQPMWRRRAHDEVGFFDESYTIAGDYEFFYRLARQLGALHIRAPLGLYYHNLNGIQISRPELTIEELGRLRKKFYHQIELEEFFPSLPDFSDDPRARGAALWALGNNCMLASMCGEFELALRYYQRAREILGDMPELLHNMAIARAGSGDIERATALFQGINEDSPDSRAIMQAIEQAGGLPQRQWRLYTFEHPVLESGRKARGVEADELLTPRKLLA